jgi:hypothetical protein
LDPSFAVERTGFDRTDQPLAVIDSQRGLGFELCLFHRVFGFHSGQLAGVAASGAENMETDADAVRSAR